MSHIHQNIMPLLSLSQEIPAICEPLFQSLDIDYFDYICVDTVNDSRIVLTSNPYCLEYYYTQSLYKHSNIVAKTLYLHEKRRYLLWSELQKVSPFRELKEVIQLYNGISLIFANEKESHLYAFASSQKKRKSDEFFIANLNVFNQFINYFNEQAYSLIQQATPLKLYIPKHEIMSSEQLFAYQRLSSQETNFERKKPLKRFYLTNGGEYLTRKEARCIFLSIQGHRAKNIADILHVAQKTVESHLNTAKEKFCCHSMRELFQKIMTSPFYHLFHLFADCDDKESKLLIPHREI